MSKTFIMLSPPHYAKPYLGIRMETQSLTVKRRVIKYRESYKYTYVHKITSTNYRTILKMIVLHLSLLVKKIHESKIRKALYKY